MAPAAVEKRELQRKTWQSLMDRLFPDGCNVNIEFLDLVDATILCPRPIVTDIEGQSDARILLWDLDGKTVTVRLTRAHAEAAVVTQGPLIEIVGHILGDEDVIKLSNHITPAARELLAPHRDAVDPSDYDLTKAPA